MSRLAMTAGMLSAPALLGAQSAPPPSDGSGRPPIEVGGYFRSLTGVQSLGYSIGEADSRSAFNGEVARIRWEFPLGDGVRLLLHDRLQAQVVSGTATLGTGVTGFGVSAVPGRSLDLESTLIDGDGFRVWHDIDRLALQVPVGAVDLTVGRQAISWGISNLFPVADLWAAFSPFELDTEEKRGVDAVRALAYPAPGLELDVVLADRGKGSDFSAGARATLELSWADVYVAGGKFWREGIALAGVSAVAGVWKLRGEVAQPWNLDGGGRSDARATVGADRLGSTHSFSVELHRNGLGASDPEDYARVLTSQGFARGETYFLGRHLLGMAGSWAATDRFNTALAILVNLDDHSTSFTPSATYDLGQSARVTLGGLVGVGSSPVADAFAPRLESEFGTYGTLGYTGIAIYF